MSNRISTKQKLISQLESIDDLLRDIANVVTKGNSNVSLEPLVEILVTKEMQLTEISKNVETHHELQKKIETLKLDCVKSDRQIRSCQLQLKKSEYVLSTALYYCRQKLAAMTKAVKNPIELEELIRFSHRISATNGCFAPENWVQGDPRRPYPNRDEIRRGFLGHIDDSGQFKPSFYNVLAETAAVNTPVPSTPGSNATLQTNSPHNSSKLASQTASSSLNLGSAHGIDNTGVSNSPAMMLPGVNMVSSPLSVPSTSANLWAATGAASTTTGVDPTNKHSILSGSGFNEPSQDRLASQAHQKPSSLDNRIGAGNRSTGCYRSSTQSPPTLGRQPSGGAPLRIGSRKRNHDDFETMSSGGSSGMSSTED